MKTIWHHIGVFVVYFFVALLVTYPAVFSLPTTLIGDGWDNFEYYGFQYIAWDKLSHLQYPFSHSDIFRYPPGFDYGSSIDGFIPVMLGALLIPLVGQVSAYNLTILLLMALNGYCAHLLAYFLSKSHRISMLAGIMYGFSSYVLARGIGHPNLMLVAGWPLLILGILKFRSFKGSMYGYTLLYTALALITLASLQYLLMLIVFSVITLPVVYFMYGADVRAFIRTFFSHKRALLISTFGFAGGMLFFLYPYFNAFISNALQLHTREAAATAFAPQRIHFFVPNPLVHTFLSSFIHHGIPSIEQSFFIGYIELLVVIWAFIKARSKHVISLAILSSIFFLLAFGLGQRYLAHIFPFVGIPEFGRFFILFYLFLTMILVVGIQQLRGRKRPLAMLVILLLMFFERVGLSYTLTQLPDTTFTESVMSSEGKGVLDIPIDPYNSVYNYYPSLYEKKIVNGYIHWTGDDKNSRSLIETDELKRFKCIPDNSAGGIPVNDVSIPDEERLNERTLALLSTYGIHTIVVHKDRKFHHPVCTRVKDITSLLVPKVEQAAATKGDEVKMSFFHMPSLPYFRYTVFFPFDGVFTATRILAAPQKLLPLSVTYDGSLIHDFDTNWSTSQDGMVWIPENERAIQVKAGTVMSFSLDIPLRDSVWWTLWYRYTLDRYDQIGEIPPIEQLYEDEQKSVYVIHQK